MPELVRVPDAIRPETDNLMIQQPVIFTREVWVHIVEHDTEAMVMLTPDNARKAADALREAADRAEYGSDS